MPRFFFHIHDRHLTIFDKHGLDRPDLDAALVDAAINAREIIAEGLRHGRIDVDRWFEIVDEAGLAVGEIPFRDLLNDEMLQV